VKRGLVEMLCNRNNWALDVATRDGQLWAATPGGAVRWRSEGDSWYYESNDRFEGLCDSYAYRLYSDQVGNLVITPYIGKGISIYDGASFENILMDQNLELRGLVIDRDMNIWASGERGILFVSRLGEFRWCGTEDGLPDGCEGYAIALSNDGHPVAIVRLDRTDWYLCGYDGHTWWTIPLPFELPATVFGTDTVKCMIVDMRDHVWFGTFVSGAIEFDGTNTTQYTYQNSGLAGNFISEITADATGKLWFSCPGSTEGYGGLCSFDGQAWGGLAGFDGRGITSVAANFNGYVFVGAREGVYVVNEGGLPRALCTSEPLLGSLGWNVAFDENGVLYLTDSEKGLWKYQDEEWSLLKSQDGLATDSAVAIEFDSRGVAWIASVAGVTRWDGSSFRTFTTEDALPSNYVFRLTVDANDCPWVLTLGEEWEISHYDGASWLVHSGDENAPENPLMLAADTMGAVWIIWMKQTSATEYEYALSNYDRSTMTSLLWRRTALARFGSLKAMITSVSAYGTVRRACVISTFSRRKRPASPAMRSSGFRRRPRATFALIRLPGWNATT